MKAANTCASLFHFSSNISFSFPDHRISLSGIYRRKEIRGNSSPVNTTFIHWHYGCIMCTSRHVKRPIGRVYYSYHDTPFRRVLGESSVLVYEPGQSPKIKLFLNFPFVVPDMYVYIIFPVC